MSMQTAMMRRALKADGESLTAGGPGSGPHAGGGGGKQSFQKKTSERQKASATARAASEIANQSFGSSHQLSDEQRNANNAKTPEQHRAAESYHDARAAYWKNTSPALTSQHEAARDAHAAAAKLFSPGHGLGK